MPKLIPILAASAAALTLSACTQGSLTREARPGDRVVCNADPNPIYIMGPRQVLSSCVDIPAPDGRREPDLGSAEEPPGARRVPRDRRLRPAS